MEQTGEMQGDAVRTDSDLLNEIQLLRQGLWACYAAAGGDPADYAAEHIGSEELVPLVLDCVNDLRGFFNAARHDSRQR